MDHKSARGVYKKLVNAICGSGDAEEVNSSIAEEVEKLDITGALGECVKDDFCFLPYADLLHYNNDKAILRVLCLLFSARCAVECKQILLTHGEDTTKWRPFFKSLRWDKEIDANATFLHNRNMIVAQCELRIFVSKALVTEIKTSKLLPNFRVDTLEFLSILNSQKNISEFAELCITILHSHIQAKLVPAGWTVLSACNKIEGKMKDLSRYFEGIDDTLINENSVKDAVENIYTDEVPREEYLAIFYNIKYTLVARVKLNIFICKLLGTIGQFEDVMNIILQNRQEFTVKHHAYQHTDNPTYRDIVASVIGTENRVMWRDISMLMGIVDGFDQDVFAIGGVYWDMIKKVTAKGVESGKHALSDAKKAVGKKVKAVTDSIKMGFKSAKMAMSLSAKSAKGLLML